MTHEVVVGQREVMVAEEAAVGGKRRRMGRSEYKMAATVNNSAFSLRVTAPKYEHEVFALCGEAADDGIGKSLPTAAGMQLPDGHVP